MRGIFAAIAGGLFGIGLMVSGMIDTGKVRGWLDVFGDWDPTLAFVMGGAILPMALAWAFAKGRSPRLGGDFPPPATPRLDKGLIIGSVLFGMGWGLSGLCPGPALASVTFNGLAGLVFLGAMALGMRAAPPLRARLDAPAK